MKIYRTIILALLLQGCETCCFILTVGQNEGVLRKQFGPNGKEIKKQQGKNRLMIIFMVCTPQ
jgi:hypothetical protein